MLGGPILRIPIQQKDVPEGLDETVSLGDTVMVGLSVLDAVLLGVRLSVLDAVLLGDSVEVGEAVAVGDSELEGD